MAKDPAFLFYSSDFITGVQDLTMEERGQYITLLCLQHQKGHFSEKAILLSVGKVSKDVMSKFRTDDEGLYYNARLDIEIEKRKDRGDSQRKKAFQMWEKKRKNNATADAAAYAGAYAEMMPSGVPSGHKPPENENENRKLEGVQGGESIPEVPIEICKDIALKDQRWVQKNKITPARLDEFNDFLERGGTFSKVPKEYKEHFRNWTNKKPAVVEMKPIKNNLDELKKRYQNPS